jgi:hypothetical protein
MITKSQETNLKKTDKWEYNQTRKLLHGKQSTELIEIFRKRENTENSYT